MTPPSRALLLDPYPTIAVLQANSPRNPLVGRSLTPVEGSPPPLLNCSVFLPPLPTPASFASLLLLSLLLSTPCRTEEELCSSRRFARVSDSLAPRFDLHSADGICFRLHAQMPLQPSAVMTAIASHHRVHLPFLVLLY